jgi:hypothetical protein
MIVNRKVQFPLCLVNGRLNLVAYYSNKKKCWAGPMLPVVITHPA